nr:hypothetical protein [Pandoravirus aubagnensis]
MTRGRAFFLFFFEACVVMDCLAWLLLGKVDTRLWMPFSLADQKTGFCGLFLGWLCRRRMVFLSGAVLFLLCVYANIFSCVQKKDDYIPRPIVKIRRLGRCRLVLSFFVSAHFT